jgi:hypothetical protein
LILKDHGIRSRLQTRLVDLIGADPTAYGGGSRKTAETICLEWTQWNKPVVGALERGAGSSKIVL